MLTARTFLSPDLLVTFDPLSEALVRSFNAKSTLYDCLDLYIEQPQYSRLPAEQEQLHEAEQRLVARVDGVSVSAKPLVARFGDSSKEVIYRPGAPMPLGVDPSRKMLVPEAVSAPIRALYIGAFDDYKVDFSVFHALLSLEPRLHLKLVGRAHHRSEKTAAHLANLSACDRVEFLEPISRDALPTLLEESDFGIIAMKPGPYSDHSFPLKLWDYLEAGIPVLASGSLSMKDVQRGVVAVSSVTGITRSVLDEVLALRDEYEELHEFAAQNSAIDRVASILACFEIELK